MMLDFMLTCTCYGRSLYSYDGTLSGMIKGSIVRNDTMFYAKQITYIKDSLLEFSFSIHLLQVLKPRDTQWK